MKKEDIKSVYKIIQSSLWGGSVPEATQEDYEEMRLHAIVALPAHILRQMSIPEELRSKWESDVLSNIAYYMKLKYVEKHLPLTVPYIILKGTSCSQYYPYPEYRTVGDIDLMTKEDDYITACNMFIEAGWREITGHEESERGRHRTFVKNTACVELHLFFSSINDPQKAEKLDCLIRQNILPERHILPDLVNGLVIIDHIYQHLRGGLGLRQIIDWMMFVDRCLTDEKWNEFESMAEQTGMRLLAITVTRICEMYLGLPEHVWCKNANEHTCIGLMDYIISCGNFSRKIDLNKRIALYRIGRLRHPVYLIRDLYGRKSKKNLNNNTKDNSLTSLNKLFGLLKIDSKLFSYYATERRINRTLHELGIDKSDDRTIKYKYGKYAKRDI